MLCLLIEKMQTGLVSNVIYSPGRNDLAGWRNNRKTSVSDGSELRSERELVSTQGAGTRSRMEALHSPEQKRDMV